MNIANIHLSAGSNINHPKIIVLHAMGQFISIDRDAYNWYLKYKGKSHPIGEYYAPYWLKLINRSAHELIDPSNVIIKCRNNNEGGWHAKGFNTDSIGIEFLVSGIHNYSSFIKRIKENYLLDNQFENGIKTVKEKLDKYSLDKDVITTHNILSPKRKHDPGTGFPLNDFLNSL